jgi:hypothetical protein
LAELSLILRVRQENPHHSPRSWLPRQLSLAPQKNGSPYNVGTRSPSSCLLSAPVQQKLVATIIQDLPLMFSSDNYVEGDVITDIHFLLIRWLELFRGADIEENTDVNNLES